MKRAAHPLQSRIVSSTILASGFGWQYGVSLLNGAVTFVTLSWLSHLLPSAAAYSQVSGILSLYVIYAVFLDLGSSGEYFRQQAENRAVPPSATPLLLTRLLFCILILPAGLLHCHLAALDRSQSAALLLLLGSLAPAAVLSTLDTVLLALGRNSYAITAKLIRVGATLCLPLVILISAESSLPTLFGAYLLLTLILALGLAAITIRLNPELRSQFRFANSLGATRTFLRNLAKPGLASIIVVSAAALFNMFLFKDVGIDHLATYVVVISLFSPITTAAQTLNTLSQRRLSAATHNPEALRQELRRITLIHAGIFLLGGTTLAAAQGFGLVALLFRHVDASFLPLVAFGIAANALAAAAVPFTFVLQLRSRRRLFFFCQVIPFTLGGILLYFLSRGYGLWGNVITFLGIQLVQFAALRWAVRRAVTSH